MTKSMTGFARTQGETRYGMVSIELKTVNSRYLDAYFRLPDALRASEALFKSRLTTKLSRGKLECSILWSRPIADKYQLNQTLVEAMLNTSNELVSLHNLQPVTVGELLSLPGIFEQPKNDYSDLFEDVLPLFEQAIDALIEQRSSEGQHLQQLIVERLDLIEKITQSVTVSYKNSLESVKEKLHTKLAEAMDLIADKVDESRFEQEMIYLLQKMDIAEEIDRLTGHIAEVRKLLQSPQAIGRKLDFLMQEMNRESNTIGSKSQSLGVTMDAVELKVLLEQIREQVQNIE